MNTAMQNEDKSVNGMTFRKDFQPRNARIVMNKGRTYLLAFDSTYNGRDFFNLREIYDQYGEWCPGKGGIQVPLEKKNDLLRDMQTYIQSQLQPAG